jgi:hypothetical protein
MAIKKKPKTKKNKSLKISQMSQQEFRDLVEQRMDRKKLQKMFGDPKDGGLLKHLRKTGQIPPA